MLKPMALCGNEKLSKTVVGTDEPVINQESLIHPKSSNHHKLLILQAIK
jgi:hypothetical protein